MSESSLFPDAYTGRCLDVSAETHAILSELFPECDLPGIYRLADSWIWTAAPSHRPRNIARFLVTWCKKESAQIARERRQENEVRRELAVG